MAVVRYRRLSFGGAPRQRSFMARETNHAPGGASVPLSVTEPGLGTVNRGAHAKRSPPSAYIWDHQKLLPQETRLAARWGTSTMSKQRRSGDRGAMRSGRRSSADASDAVLWREEEDGGGDVVAANGEEAGWKCWRHPSQPRYGVCPACLRDRLLLLCPDCARIRPCICGSFASSSSSSSSCSSLSSAEPIRSASRRGDGAEIGAVGPVSRLIEREPAFQRSRSVGFQLLRSKPTAPAGADVEPTPSRSRGPNIWVPFWRRNQPMEDTKQPNLYRSRSVAAGHLPDAGAGAETEGIRKRLRWHFPSPIKALRSRKAPAKADVK